jgi:uncharacterized protein
VNLPVWWWNETDEHNWGAREAQVSEGGITAQASAVATEIVWDTGDGNQVVCDEGVPWAIGADTLSPPCGYAYPHASQDEPDGTYTVTAVSTWEVEWSVTGPSAASGTLTLHPESSVEIEIGPKHLSKLDTIEACTTAVGPDRCHLALSGDVEAAYRADEIHAAVAGWTITPQRGTGFGERLANAHAAVSGSVVQIGMDTPQVTPAGLLTVAAGLDEADAVLAPAEDGGWWALALRDPSAAGALIDVPMSTPQTYAATRSALEGRGLRVAEGERLRDVDHLADVAPVAAAAPNTRFAAVAAEIVRVTR